MAIPDRTEAELVALIDAWHREPPYTHDSHELARRIMTPKSPAAVRQLPAELEIALTRAGLRPCNANLPHTECDSCAARRLILAYGDQRVATDVREPMQPLELDAHGVWRFRRNVLVEYLLNHGGIDLNHLARVHAPVHDQEQLAQLIGYSLSGYAELSYVRNESYEAAARKVFDAADPAGRR